MNNKQLPPLPERLCIDDDKAEFSADQMREYALQAIAHATQPAEVTRDEVMQAAKEATAPEWQDVVDGWHMGLDLMAFARAILALRPVQAPMTDDERDDMICTVTTLCAGLSRQAIAGMSIDWTEAHHGITAQAKKETP